jgi:hypothetical protein
MIIYLWTVKAPIILYMDAFFYFCIQKQKILQITNTTCMEKTEFEKRNLTSLKYVI